MSTFITRVELHGAAASDLEAMDRAVLHANFARIIPSAKGVGYQMPPGTYYSHSHLQASAVRDLAMNVVRGLGLRYDIVTAAGDISFFLHPVR